MTVLVLGGSQGAHRVNMLVLEAAALLNNVASGANNLSSDKPFADAFDQNTERDAPTTPDKVCTDL